MKIKKENIGELVCSVGQTARIVDVLDNGQVELETPFGDRLAMMDDGHFILLGKFKIETGPDGLKQIVPNDGR